MREFNRSRIKRKSEEEVTKKTVLLGLATVILFVLMVVFGLPLLVKFSVFLGNSRSRVVDTDIDKGLPPLPPRLILPFEATKSAVLNIYGVAEAGVEVELLKDDVTVERVTTDEGGGFVFNSVGLDEGENMFTALAVNNDGVMSDVSQVFRVRLDEQAPSLEMTNPSESELSVESADFDIVGLSEKEASVVVNGRLAIMDDGGRFKLKLQLKPGKNEIKVVATDLAGNETAKDLVITYDI